MKPFLIMIVTILSLCAQGANADETTSADNKKRVVFLGDSNTYAGTYVAFAEAVVRLHGDHGIEIINVGLPSETVTGLSEPDHPFPRPDVHERLDRVLQKLKPDLVIASYGINDGIYHPFSEERFRKFQEGIDKLVRKVKASGAEIVLLTPPPFDPLPQRKANKLQPLGADKFAWFAVYEDYDSVMKRYSDWMRSYPNAKAVIDLRTPIINYTNQQRQTSPDFTLSNDGVHFGTQGHRLIAKAILRSFDIPYIEPDPQLLELVQKKQKLLRDAWLTEIGHKRPGVKKGLPLAEAAAEARKIDREIGLWLTHNRTDDRK